MIILPIRICFAVVTLLALLGVQVAQGQAFEKGYLVLPKGDTLRGEVENAFWTEPPITVRFRANTSALPVTYPTRHLREMAFASGRLFRHELLPLDQSAEIRVNYLTTSREPHPKPDSVLADVLATGPVALLAVTLNENKHFFLRRAGQPWLELAGRNYLLYGQGPARIADANNYKGQLSLYFVDCPLLTRQLETMPFTTEAMQNLVEAYNRGCSAEAIARTPASRVRNQAGSTLGLGLLVGVRYNSLLVTSVGAIDVLNGADFDGRPHLQGGGYLNLMAPGRRLGLYAGLQASGVGRQQPITFAATARTKAGSIEWHGALVALQAGLRYFAPSENGRVLFLGGGYEFNTFWNMTSRVVYDNEIYDFIPRFYGSLLPYLEVGINHDRLSLVLNGRVYAPGQVQISTTSSYSYLPVSLSLNVAYRLNSNPERPE